MSAQPPQNSEHSVSQPIKWRRLWWLVVLGMLVIGWLVWRWMQPASYKLVSKFPMAAFDYFPCTTGFLTCPQFNTFVFHDWHGKELWRVTAPAVRISGRVYGGLIRYQAINVTPALSPHGEYFAVAEIKPKIIRLCVWHHGQRVGEFKLPIPPHTPGKITSLYATFHGFGLRALDNGCIYLWRRDDNNLPMYVVRGNKILAQGAIKFPSEDKLCDIALSPDAQTLTYLNPVAPGGYTYKYCTVMLTPPEVIFSSPTTLIITYTPMDNVQLFSNGIILTYDGVIIKTSGRNIPSQSWRLYSQDTGGKYAFQTKGNHVRIFAPLTRDTWSYMLKEYCPGGRCTENGQYAICLTSRSLPEPLNKLNNRVPSFLQLHPATFTLNTYVRPGRLLARLRVPNTAGQIELYKDGGSEISWVNLSPDGHALAMLSQSDSSPIRMEMLLYRY